MKKLLLDLSTSDWMRKRVSRSRLARRLAGRFVGGETRGEALDAARRLHDAGMATTLDFLGETVQSLEEAVAARDEYLALLEEAVSQKVPTHVSLKPSQLGLSLDADACLQNVIAIAERAQAAASFLRIDMEDSPLTEKTLALYNALLRRFDNVGIVLQSYLYRTEEDLRTLVETAPSIRLCKGAYREPADVAFPKKADVDTSYLSLTQIMMEAAKAREPFWPAIASHDEKMVAAALSAAAKQKLDKDRFEFQMLYGIGRSLQNRLVDGGYRVRIYLPYGTHWYPYLMRRMAERPANLLFVLKNLFR